LKLGSIDLVVSNRPKDSPRDRKTPRGATLNKIEKAFGKWLERCDKNAENLALFFFCGHGLQKDSMLILPSDFDSSAVSPCARAIDFDALYRGTTNCKAKWQFFIIDACRQWTHSMLQDINTSGVKLGRANVAKQKKRTVAQLYGSGEGLMAFGDRT